MATTYYYTVEEEIIGEDTAGVRLDYLTDALGSVTATIDQTGVVTQTCRYKPFGTVLSGPALKLGWIGDLGYRSNNLKYSEYYVRARHFGSYCAQWLTLDRDFPAEYAYVYVFDNPATLTDQSGNGSAPKCPDCKNFGGWCAPSANACAMTQNEINRASYTACCSGKCLVCVSLNYLSQQSATPPIDYNNVINCIKVHEGVHCSQLKKGKTKCGYKDSSGWHEWPCGCIFHPPGTQKANECEAYLAQWNCMRAAYPCDSCACSPMSNLQCQNMCEICDGFKYFGCNIPAGTKGDPKNFCNKYCGVKL